MICLPPTVVSDSIQPAREVTVDKMRRKFIVSQWLIMRRKFLVHTNNLAATVCKSHII
jgi:hypothetical protein